ncbi:MAG: mevalonate kinase [Streptococcaceae bacterium]|jgi:mevalonate kinase|nr:mevalonate kinase [Streptococcaceae bacterium]
MRVQKIGIGEAHAKLILVGEHAVVYGQPAIALPVTILKMKVTLTEQGFGQYIEDADMRRRLERMGEDFEGIRQLILRLLAKFHAEKLPFSLEIDSNIPRGRGLGASAALATAITRAFYNFFDTELSMSDIFYHVNFSETIMHGRASGVDAAAVNSSKPIWFVKGTPMKTIDVTLAGFLVIADSGIRGRTTQAVSIVQNNLIEKTEETEKSIAALGQLTHDVRKILGTDNLESLGVAMNQAQENLEKMGVSHPTLETLIRAARKSGALGAKLTGSGLGGVIIALAPSEIDAVRISQSLALSGAQNTWIFNI